MSTEIVIRQNGTAALEQAIVAGDLSKLSPDQRIALYMETCRSLGLNPYTKPFDYLHLNGKLVLYPLRAATDQLRRANGVSVTGVRTELQGDLAIVTVTASDRSGRLDSEIGAVSVANLKGEALANAMMKAITKAKRRVTLSLCGLGWIDDSEVDSVPGAQRVSLPDSLPRPEQANPEYVAEFVAPPEPEPAPSAPDAAPPKGSIEALWVEWRQMVARCDALGIAHGNPPDDASAVELRTGIKKYKAALERREANAAPAPEPVSLDEVPF